jgi:hypothetical protein
MQTMRDSWTDERLDNLNGSMNERFDQVDDRFEQIDSRFAQVDASPASSALPDFFSCSEL